jgi:hypothetical protein
MIVIQNPWGTTGNQDVQRSDLWLVDLQPAITYFDSQSDSFFSKLGLDKDLLLDKDNANFYATRVTLPVHKINSVKVLQGTVPRNFPGYFEAVDTVRIDFRHDSGNMQSPLVVLLQAWRALTRSGRVGSNNEPYVLLDSATSKPSFQFEIKITLLNGGTDSGDDIVAGDSYRLIDCWPRIIQQNRLDRSTAAQQHLISVQFQIKEII